MDTTTFTISDEIQSEIYLSNGGNVQLLQQLIEAYVEAITEKINPKSKNKPTLKDDFYATAKSYRDMTFEYHFGDQSYKVTTQSGAPIPFSLENTTHKSRDSYVQRQSLIESTTIETPPQLQQLFRRISTQASQFSRFLGVPLNSLVPQIVELDEETPGQYLESKRLIYINSEIYKEEGLDPLENGKEYLEFLWTYYHEFAHDRFSAICFNRPDETHNGIKDPKEFIENLYDLYSACFYGRCAKIASFPLGIEGFADFPSAYSQCNIKEFYSELFSYTMVGLYVGSIISHKMQTLPKEDFEKFLTSIDRDSPYLWLFTQPENLQERIGKLFGLDIEQIKGVSKLLKLSSHTLPVCTPEEWVTSALQRNANENNFIDALNNSRNYATRRLLDFALENGWISDKNYIDILSKASNSHTAQELLAFGLENDLIDDDNRHEILKIIDNFDFEIIPNLRSPLENPINTRFRVLRIGD